MRTKKFFAVILMFCIVSLSLFSVFQVSAKTFNEQINTQTSIIENIKNEQKQFSINYKMDFYNFMNTPEYWTVDYKVILNCDIDVDDIVFEPIKKFSGTFDGCGHTISNFVIQDSHKSLENFEIGFIETLDGFAEFKNVIFDNYTIKDKGSSLTWSTSYQSAGFVLTNHGTISNIKFKNSNMDKINNNIILKNSNSAGFVLRNEKDGIIENCHIENMSVKDTNIKSGFVGINYGKITNSSTNLSVNNGSNVGGFVSENSGIIEKCSFKGRVAANKYIGGFVSLNKNTINDCTAEVDDITGSNYVGGFAYRNDAGVYNCNVKGIVEATTDIKNNICGGFVVENNGTIEGCSEEGEVTGKNCAGGFCAINRCDIHDSKSKCTVIADTEDQTACAGGFVGRNEKGNISNCTSLGFDPNEVDLTNCSLAKAESSRGIAKAGGFVGVNDANITSSEAKGYVYVSGGATHPDSGCGGFVGTNDKNGYICNCYAETKIRTTNNIEGSGFVGEALNRSVIKNSQCKTMRVSGVVAKFCYLKELEAVIDDNCHAI